ncbi:MAG TPA: hypothetical protein VI603_17115 [Saprospiraceae bacterium]|nr:hypothetical protein [Saprospiraceae bacterium]
MKSLVLLLPVALLMSSCIQLSTFQTAKTVGKGNGEILIAIGGGGVSESFEDNSSIGFGTFELGGRLGVSEKVDIGLKVSHFVSYLVDVKYQFVGDQSSKFAMATGPGIGLYAFGFGTTLFQATLPLHMSVHPSERFGIYFTPRYSAQFAVGEGSGSLNYLGGSVGFEAGQNVRFGTDISYMRLLDDVVDDSSFTDFGLGLFQVGVGVKFRINRK